MKSESIKEIAGALCKFQSQIKAVKRESENPFFKSKYADLASIWDAIRKPLADNGLSVVQGSKRTDDNSAVIETILLHTSGEWVSGELPVYVKDFSPQGLGSGITYARRYALAAILGISTEDDDGENAEGRNQSVTDKALEALTRADDLDKIAKLTEWWNKQSVSPAVFDQVSKKIEEKSNVLRAKK